MIEPKKEEGHSILDVIEEEPKKQGYTWKIIIGLVIASDWFGFHPLLGKDQPRWWIPRRMFPVEVPQ